MNKKRIYIISSTLLLIGLFAGVIQYVGMFDALYAAATNPGHSWSQMECSTALCIDTTNNRVGVGTMTPQTTFDVNGAIKIGESTTCNSSLRGSIKYSGGSILICNGVSWIVTASAPYQGDNFTDSRDGEVYKTVVIGGKTWMAENLRYLPVSYTNANGDSSATAPRYYYQGSTYTVAQLKAWGQYRIYGILYNRPAALSACPSGWHLPSNNEMKDLEYSLGISLGELDNLDDQTRGAAVKIRRAFQGTTIWREPDGTTKEGSVTSVYFNLPPAGIYYGSADVSYSYAALWTSTAVPNTEKFYIRMFMNVGANRDGSIIQSAVAHYAFSIRCVKD